jgi:methylenetetrahydrofolate reductase (NADPH)
VKISEILRRKKFTLSFEIFPPKRDGDFEGLFCAISELTELSPDFISVTYGAGGSNKERTIEIASRVKNDFNLEVLAHLTCVGSTKEDISAILASLQEKNIENILALRGDPPADSGIFEITKGGFAFANELVSFIKKDGSFSIGVAGYPQGHMEASSLEEDIINLKRKVDSGADFIISQLFFDNSDFYRFLELADRNHITVPVIPGILPILNYKQTKRIIELNGHPLPAVLDTKIGKIAEKPAEVEKYGIEHATRQAEDLISNGIHGIHFYCMNRSVSVKKILGNLNFSK